ncbi:putative GTPase [Desulfobaculum xiamenense]|uniref:Putative GTPase n=1 Tax=Desulfobaculum xiamenense TaxID=995050 RepID=A0A846QLT0_9BACT|nr:cyclic 2,3-diphosphoglycerate synthase [Desulfobaculum xiamenense]NJB67163.1 putative GTPase [Desulfobaculum xiamenense]
MVEKVVIMGAAGRDFHNFNVYFRDNPRYEVVAFTAAQIEGIEGRAYPAELAGGGYPQGIPIRPESELRDIIRKHRVDLVAFSYSDVPHMQVMHTASQVMAEGADFMLIGATYTMLEASCPVVSVCAVRTGCGKSPTTRKVCDILRARGRRVVVVRHPMPYGDLSRQIVQRYETVDDFDQHRCTIEEREEYEPLVECGLVVYAGVDYAAILREAEREADVIVWDGGNNDTPFFRSTVHITVFDPHRAGHELTYYPGETNMLMADIAVINKVDTAPSSRVREVMDNIAAANPSAEVVLAKSPVTVDDPAAIAGRRVLVVEDGPTLTHGGMAYGAGTVAARTFGAAELVDPRPFACGSIAGVFERYTHIGPVLPAMGYHAHQLTDLERTINAVDCDLVLFGTPARLGRFLRIEHPTMRVRYDYADGGPARLEDALLRLLDERGAG